MDILIAIFVPIGTFILFQIVFEQFNLVREKIFIHRILKGVGLLKKRHFWSKKHIILDKEDLVIYRRILRSKSLAEFNFYAEKFIQNLKDKNHDVYSWKPKYVAKEIADDINYLNHKLIREVKISREKKIKSKNKEK